MLRMFRGVSKRFLFGYVKLYQYILNYKDDAADKILETLLKDCNIKCAWATKKYKKNIKWEFSNNYNNYNKNY